MGPIDAEGLRSLYEPARDWLHARPGVERTSIGLGRDGSPALKVYHGPGLSEDDRRAIAARLAGVPIEFHAVDPDERIRPL